MYTVRTRAIGLIVVFLIVVSFTLLLGTEQVATATSLPQQVGSGEMIAGQGSASPQRATANLSEEPPELTEEQLQRLEEALALSQQPGPTLQVDPATSDLVPQPDMPETMSGSAMSLFDISDTAAPQAPGDYVFFRNVDIRDTANLAGNVSSINEPSADARDDAIFMTGNFYAAFSTDRGQFWQFVDPATTFPANDGGFCCDQVVIYDQSRDLMFWLLQYWNDGTDNRQRLAVIHGSDLQAGMTGTNWYYYDFFPDSVGLPDSDRWFDYPKMALSDDFLYINTNVFEVTQNCGTPTNPKHCWTDSAAWRIPLDELNVGGTINYQFFTRSDTPSLMPVDGTTATMYWGTHNSLSEVRIYRWAENSGTVFWDDVGIALWSSGPQTCLTPDGFNPCNSSDGRMLAGWLANGNIGFMWNAGQDDNFPFPYVNAARFDESTRSLVDQPLIWNPEHAWLYPSVAVNGRGHIAGSVFVAGGDFYSQMNIFIDDDFSNPPPPGWENYYVRESTHGPSNDRWGDYVASRRHEQYPNTWISTGFTLQGGSGNNNARPQLVWHGRVRDQPPSTPDNDDFDSPKNLTLSGIGSQSTIQATTAVDDPLASCGSSTTRRQSHSVWYRFTPPSTSSYTFSTEGSNYDTVLALWIGSRGVLIQRGCNDDVESDFTSSLTQVLNDDTTYYIEVMSFGSGSGGQLSLDIVRNQPIQPANLQAPNVIGNQIDLTWDDNSEDESYFIIERSLNSATNLNAATDWLEIGTTTNNSYSDTAVECNTTYYYRIRAYRDIDGQFSDYSNTVSATTEICIVYIPLILNNFVTAPDLVIEEVIVTESDAVACIRNEGSVTSTKSFWVDLYVDPAPEPTGVNQVWADGRSQHGLVWGGTTTIAPDELLCLTIGDDYFWPSLSDFPASLPEGTPIYVQVDSANAGTSYGNVLETHEVNGSAYNNILGPVFSTSGNTLTASFNSFPKGKAIETNQPLPTRP